MKPSVVFVVDDDEAFRNSLSWLLGSNGIAVICHESGEFFLKALGEADHSVPMCVLLDINMQGLTGVEIQSKLTQKYPHIPVAFITGFGEISTVIMVFQQGAVDFIQKPFDEKIICTLVNKMLLQAKSNLEELLQLNDIVEKFNKLTAREVQVFNCILDEMLNREIAQLLDISIKTVEARRASVMEKFGVRRLAGLFHAAHLLSEAKRQGF